jgi:5'-nucleotidase
MKPRVLVTNDDGIHSAGLRELVRHLAVDNDVLVVAPEGQQSAVGHSITLHKPLRLERVDLDLGDLPVEAYTTNGTPADCIVLGCLEDLGKPDIVVSGINLGHNLGEEIFYSGTVSAAMEGVIQRKPAFSISVTAYREPIWTPAARFAANLARYLLENAIPSGSFLNVNVPNRPAGELLPPKVTRLGRRCYINQLEKRTDPRGRAYYWFAGHPCELDSGPDTDIGAVHAGHISVTPVHMDATDHELLARLRNEEARFAFDS